LALERQDRLCAPIATLFRGTACGIALDEEQLRKRRIALLTVRELPRQSRDVEQAFAARHLTSLARCFASTRGVDDLGDDRAGLWRRLEQKFLEALRHDRLDDALHLRRD